MPSYIHPTAEIMPGVELGANHWVGPYAVIGYRAQIRDGGHLPVGRVRIGDNAVIHEHVSIQSGYFDTTVIGDDVYLMCFTHVAHDSRLGDHVTMAGHANLGGHTRLDDWSFLGSHAVTHQRARVGMGVMVGANSYVKGETGIWEVWYGSPARRGGFNQVGWDRYNAVHAQDLGSRRPA